MALLHCLLPPEHQVLKLTQVYRLFLRVMHGRFSWQSNTKRPRAPPCDVVPLTSIAGELSWLLTVTCSLLHLDDQASPVHSAHLFPLHPSLPSFDLSLCGSFSPLFFPPLLCDLTICLCASSAYRAYYSGCLVRDLKLIQIFVFVWK